MTYLTIHEFGSLRGVSVGSLRYYEKIGLLKPAKVDPDTGYRYYLPEQIGTLDAIQICVALDIPLKELENYMDSDRNLDLEKFLTHGREILSEKIEIMNTKMKLTEYGLDMLRENDAYSEKKGTYSRKIEDRWFYLLPASGDEKKLQAEQKQLFNAFRTLHEKNMAPFFPAGIIFRINEEQIKASYFLPVLHPDETNTSIVRIPGGTYQCLQKEMSDRPNIRDIVQKNFPRQKEQTVIVTNMMTGKLHYQSRLSEIQVPAFPL